MPIKRELAVGIPAAEEVFVRNNGVLDIAFNYSCPERSRNAVTSISFRVTTDVVSAEASMAKLNETDVGTRVVTTSSGNKFEVVIKARKLLEDLDLGLIRHMNLVQTGQVVYRRVECVGYDTVTWDTAKGTSNVTTSPLTEIKRWRFKCGAVAGQSDSVSTNHKALAFSLYGKDLQEIGDKPSRLLISGVVFKNFSEAASNEAVVSIYNFLKNGLTFKTLDSADVEKTISLKPIVNVGGHLREIDIVVLEGLSNVAGAGRRTSDTVG